MNNYVNIIYSENVVCRTKSASFIHYSYACSTFDFSDAVVKVERDNNTTVKILGLDNHGYLLAEKSDGSQISLQDDGNSFDMMANLIRIKTT